MFILSLSGIALLVAVVYFSYMKLKRKRKKRNMITILQNHWEDKLELRDNRDYIRKLRKIYDCCEGRSEAEIDDITWNDMEMDGVFDWLNNTYSTIGEIYLYKMLRNPVLDEKSLKERDRVIQYFQTHEQDRLEKQYQLNHIGKVNTVSIYEYQKEVEKIKTYSILPHVVIPVLQIISTILTVINFKYFILLFLVILAINFITYYKRDKTTELYYPLCMQIGSLLNNIRKMNDMEQITELEKYSAPLMKLSQIAKKYNLYYRLFGCLTYGNFPDIDVLYDSLVKPFFHTDLIVFNRLLRFIKINMPELIDAYETVGFLDAMISIASVRHKCNLYGYRTCIPNFRHKICFSAGHIYLPFIENAVSNDIVTEKSVLITGSNATGKSTFLRTVGVNAILSQTIYTAFASSYSSSFFHIMSSINIHDNVYYGESYYMMEIKAIRRIIHRIDSKVPVLCCIDEVLRGTNTIERIAASSTILENMSKRNSICFVASHDLELTYLLEDSYENYHFQEDVDSNGIVCDYILHCGRAYSRNAIKLLQFFGYSDKIIDEAQSRVNDFLSNGKWQV